MECHFNKARGLILSSRSRLYNVSGVGDGAFLHDKPIPRDFIIRSISFATPEDNNPTPVDKDCGDT
jgi:hypothetical protein